MILLELFDKPYSFELVPGRMDDDFLAAFKDDDGKLTIVNFEFWAGPDLYIVDFKRDGKFDLTGDSPKDKQIAIRVLATVVEAIRQVIEQKKPFALAFSAKSDETSRVKLYDSMVKRMAKSMGYELVTDASKVNHRVFPKFIQNSERMQDSSTKRTYLVRAGSQAD